MEQQIRTVKLLLGEVLDKLTIDGRVDFCEDNDCPRFIIKTEEVNMLIGENGKHLLALNHLVKKIAENKFKGAGLEKITFFLDVNDFQMKKIEELRNTARVSAQRAIFFKKEVEMDPMSSYDRRIVHSSLSGHLDIKTESVGEGLDRRVVIKPIEQNLATDNDRN